MKKRTKDRKNNALMAKIYIESVNNLNCFGIFEKQ